MCGVYVHIFFIFLLLSAVFTFEYAQRLIWLQVIFARFFADSPSDGFVFVRRLHLSIGLCAPFFTSSMKVHASSIVESENFSALKPNIVQAIVCLKDWTFEEAKMESQLDELCGMVMKIKVDEEEEDISYPSPSPCQSLDQHEFSSKASSSATIF
ncbi:uncharacterized protein LOC130802490 [Amaranthus tricolor]|uniref:uncharacterized protein LOC130802490 n=1 Tax=Amaranthus tricolor TaxID=29722 RepID=UPI00258D47DB|nr:uncharacterized protein LOC130802490 [Amaranthus tricolor]